MKKEVTYPIFLKDRASLMQIINSKEDLNDKTEDIEIRDGEYTAWDLNGYLCELFMEAPVVINVRVVSSEPQFHELKESILEYAEIARPGEKVKGINSNESIVQLFIKVNSFVEENSLINKTKRWFKRIFL